MLPACSMLRDTATGVQDPYCYEPAGPRWEAPMRQELRCDRSPPPFQAVRDPHLAAASAKTIRRFAPARPRIVGPVPWLDPGVPARQTGGLVRCRPAPVSVERR